MAVIGEPGGSAARGSAVQPVLAGTLAALVGFGSTFAVILSGLSAVGATPAQAASGLMIVCVLQGAMSVVLSALWRLPVAIVWSTPAFALMIGTGATAGGFPAVLGATIVAGVLVVLAGAIAPFRRLVEAIPPALANAMLAGILFEICLAPVQAAKASPHLILPVILAWALALRFIRRWAVPVAVLVTVLIVVLVTPLPPGAFDGTWPRLVITMPTFRPDVIVDLAIPLFIVTMASQNIPGLAVLRANGFEPNLRAVFVLTGLGSLVATLGSGGLLNLAAITAALCAGPEAHPDPRQRYWSTIVMGGLYVLLGLFAAVSAAFIVAAPPAIVQAVAGLALLGTLAGSLAAALGAERDRLAVAVAFVTTASGVTALGIGASFWGLVAGGLIMLVEHRRARPPAGASQPAGGLLAARK